MKVTAQWIADQCGVSRGTVDRVVNGRPNVSPEVRERIQKLISEYGYKTPSQRQAARAGRGVYRIGVILPSWDAFFIRRMRDGIRTAVHNRGLNDITVLVEELKNRSPRSYFEAIGRMEERGIDLAPVRAALDALADDGATPLIFARDRQLIGVLGAADEPKATSREAIAKFEALGLSVVMLTGDNARTAEAMRRRMGIGQVIAGVLPEHKAAHVKELQAAGHRVAMIGDGINDAPALAQADVGIAIGAGTDIAIDSADAVLMKSDLLDAVNAVRLARSVLRNIKENLFWALIYNTICIPLAAGILYPAFGLKLSPIVGAATMSLSSVCVVLNALRLRFFRPLRAEAAETAGAEQKAAAVQAAAAEAISHEKKEGTMMKTTLKIKGMMCAHCQQHVHDALSKMAGVTGVQVDLEGGSADVEASREIPQQEFAQVIADAGYELVG